MNATIDETNPIPTDERNRRSFSRYPCWPTYSVHGLWPWRVRGCTPPQPPNFVPTTDERTVCSQLS